MNSKLIKLEAVRGAAALYVVLHHTIRQFELFNIDLSFIFRFGQEAVILFFILSGFVIEYSYSRAEDKSFKTYFFKRFFRIYIPLFFVLITHLTLYSINNSLQLDWKTLIGNIFMLQDSSSKPNILVSPFLNNQPLWSLSYEWWFYMLFFPIVYFFKKSSSLVVCFLAIISALTYTIYPNFFNRELMYLAIWWSGVEIARLYLKGYDINTKNLKFIIIVLFTITSILGVNAYYTENISTVSIGIHPILEVRHFGFSIIAILFAILWKKLQWVGFSLTLGVFSRFAPISYVFYISHFFLIASVSYLDNIISNDILKNILYILICLGFSYLIERIIYINLNKILMKKIIK